MLLLALLLVPGWPVRAQASGWQVWLYNPGGVMTYVDSSGVARDIALPSVQGHAYPQRVAVSRDGRLVAYMTSNEALRAHRLVIFDLQAESVRADFVLTDLLASGLDYHASPSVFNETGVALAVGLTTLDGQWRVLVLNTASGAILSELRSDNPVVAALGLPAGALVPVVRHFGTDDVAFDLQFVDGNGESIAASLLWNPATGSLADNVNFPAAGDVSTATGDIILSGRDERFAANPALGPEQHNVLYVYNPASGRRFPFYHDAERSLGQPRFIQNDELILAPASDAWGRASWMVLERNGVLRGELSLPAGDLSGFGDGFIYLTAGDLATLMVAPTRDGVDAGYPVGQGPPGVTIQLAWAGDLTPHVSAYEPWIDLSDPVSIARATQAVVAAAPTPTPAVPVTQPEVEVPFFVAPTPAFLPTPPAFQSALQVGGLAVVTEAGHAAGLRTSPSADAPAIILLYTNMYVDVLEGPEITDGYIWWRVRTRGERVHTGWAIEGAQGHAWLVPVAP
nr:MAG: hypothetical protein DIU68_11495 [Chloroflexota bacterium]